MDWNVFNAHNEAPDDAFETMCVLLFKNWVNREYGQSGVEVHAVNGKAEMAALKPMQFYQLEASLESRRSGLEAKLALRKLSRSKTLFLRR